MDLKQHYYALLTGELPPEHTAEAPAGLGRAAAAELLRIRKRIIIDIIGLSVTVVALIALIHFGRTAGGLSTTSFLIAMWLGVPFLFFKVDLLLRFWQLMPRKPHRMPPLPRVLLLQLLLFHIIWGFSVYPPLTALAQNVGNRTRQALYYSLWSIPTFTLLSAILYFGFGVDSEFQEMILIFGALAALAYLVSYLILIVLTLRTTRRRANALLPLSTPHSTQEVAGFCQRIRSRRNLLYAGLLAMVILVGVLPTAALAGINLYSNTLFQRRINELEAKGHAIRIASFQQKYHPSDPVVVEKLDAIAERIAEIYKTLHDEDGELMPDEQIAAVFAEHRADLEAADQFLRDHPKIVLPRDLVKGELSYTLLPQLNLFRNWAKMNVLQFRIALKASDSAAAECYFENIMFLAEYLSGDPFLLAWLNEVSVYSIGLEALREAAWSGQSIQCGSPDAHAKPAAASGDDHTSRLALRV